MYLHIYINLCMYSALHTSCRVNLELVRAHQLALEQLSLGGTGSRLAFEIAITNIAIYTRGVNGLTLGVSLRTRLPLRILYYKKDGAAVGLYTILPLPISCGLCCTTGGSGEHCMAQAQGLKINSRIKQTSRHTATCDETHIVYIAQPKN